MWYLYTLVPGSYRYKRKKIGFVFFTRKRVLKIRNEIMLTIKLCSKKTSVSNLGLTYLLLIHYIRMNCDSVENVTTRYRDATSYLHWRAYRNELKSIYNNNWFDLDYTNNYGRYLSPINLLSY